MTRQKITVQRRWTRAGRSPYASVPWRRHDARIDGPEGKAVFELEQVEVPEQWSDLATNVVASKYLRSDRENSDRENSVRQLVSRVVDTLVEWGRRGEYFATDEDAHAFSDELAHGLLNQIGAFNSPVWFNVGVEDHPQCSACFINSVTDSMESILELAKTEGMLFKFGSGSGTNLSTLRASTEPLSGGGTASGPVSFMRGFDAFAGVIKSGGRTRRAAKMVILDVDHPDIEAFIRSKADEERKAAVLIEAGYDPSLDGEAYRSVFFQNANHSVRVPDAFMEAVRDGTGWETYLRVGGAVASTHRASELLRKSAEAAHACGDPGLQFDTTINAWHTCKGSGRINASNPCSEYMFLDDTACNLASLNLMRLRTSSGDLDVPALRHAVRIFISAMEIIVDNAGYPTEAIAENSRRFRPLGLGYTNLGALLMARGLPYDSELSRALAGSITALLTGEAYAQSARLAAAKGAFEGYSANEASMGDVLRMHQAALDDLGEGPEPGVKEAAKEAWAECLSLGADHGYRNAQATVIAPTGTISFMMDCDTTGIEPELSLLKHKALVGGGQLDLPNHAVPEALERLGYNDEQRKGIVDFIATQGGAEGAPNLKDEHVPVFDCAFSPWAGGRSISPQGHIRMMAAVQPFVSGAISKTVNLPGSATPEDIESLFVQAWEAGLKSIAVYRDGCKIHQPLSAGEAVVRQELEEAPEGPGCGECGNVMHLTGACFICDKCGATVGCA